MLRCRLSGHRFRFTTDQATMRWACKRDCGARGAKTYPTAADAARYAQALDREGREGLGRRVPLGALPLRLYRIALSRRRNGRTRARGSGRASHDDCPYT